MHAMKRWAWNIFCALSLLRFALSVTLWVRSCFIGDSISRVWQPTGSSSESYEADCSRGAVQFAHLQFKHAGAADITGRWSHVRTTAALTLDLESELASPSYLHFAGFQFVLISANNPKYGVWGWGVQVPLWLFLPAGIPPFLWPRKRRKARGVGFPMETTAMNAPAP